MIQRFAKIALIAVVLLGGALYGLHLYYRGQIFKPAEIPADPDAAPFDVRVVRIETWDGLPLEAWYHGPEPGEPVVLYLHGNSKTVGSYIRGTAPLVKAGYGVLMLEYRGYGGNPGTPSDEGLLRDARAALNWLEDGNVDSQTVTLYGYSLGTGVAVPLAAQEDVRGVVLAAPFASIAAMGYESYPKWFVDLLLTDRFDSVDLIDDVTEPVLILHGSADRTVPPEQSERLAEAGGDNVRRIVVEGADHGWDLFEPRGNALILDFLAGLYENGGPPAAAAP